MKKMLFTLIAIMISTLFANAQQVIELPYSKFLIKGDSKWGKWDSKWNSEVAEVGSSPLLILKKENNTTFWILKVSNFPESEIGVFDKLIYDSAKTEEIRKKNSNENLTAYKYEDSPSNLYLWTEHVTLDEIYRSQSKWNTTKNAKIYQWNSRGASLYTSGASLNENHIHVNDF